MLLVKRLLVENMTLGIYYINLNRRILLKFLIILCVFSFCGAMMDLEQNMHIATTLGLI